MDNPIIVVLSGPPLMGKTTIAQTLSQKTRFLHIDIDDVRNEIDATRKKDSTIILSLDEEIAIMSLSYRLLCEKAGDQVIQNQKGIIISGTFSRKEFKKPLLELKDRLNKVNIPLKVFQLDTSKNDVEERIKKRQKEGSKSNINTLEKFQWAKGFFVPLQEVEIIKNRNGKENEVIDNILLILENFQMRK